MMRLRRILSGERNVFSFIEERSESAALDMRYYLAPWDRAIFQGNTAVISSISVFDEVNAAAVFGDFRNWCAANDVKLVNCRLAQDKLAECGFLEAQGFRFIELNYRPSKRGLEEFSDGGEVAVELAVMADEDEICHIASRIFETGRLHLDPQVGPELGDRRYAAWVANAFRADGQQVLKCVLDGRIIGFLVVEQPTQTSRFWSLVGLAPGLAGRGMGRRVWQAMLAYHHREGVEEVSTSISSHNVRVHNLYVSLGFRFPAPTITLHWCPQGPLNRQTP